MTKQWYIPFFILFHLSMYGQTEMLIKQISGRTVVRENFNKDGKLLNKQIFEAGKIIEENGYYQIEVITQLFDDKGQSEEKYTTTYRCKPAEESVMVMAFPFAKPKAKETEIKCRLTRYIGGIPKWLQKIQNSQHDTVHIVYM